MANSRSSEDTNSSIPGQRPLPIRLQHTASHFSLLNALWVLEHQSLLSVITTTKIQVFFVLENGLNFVLNIWPQSRSLEKATASNSGAKDVSYSRENEEFQPGSVSKEAERLLLLAQLRCAMEMFTSLGPARTETNRTCVVVKFACTEQQGAQLFKQLSTCKTGDIQAFKKLC